MANRILTPQEFARGAIEALRESYDEADGDGKLDLVELFTCQRLDKPPPAPWPEMDDEA